MLVAVVGLVIGLAKITQADSLAGQALGEGSAPFAGASQSSQDDATQASHEHVLGMSLAVGSVVVGLVGVGLMLAWPKRKPRAVRVVEMAGSSVSDRLRSLDEAHAEGLISREEYERSRSRILDSP